MREETPKGRSAVSQDGNCSVALRFDLAMGRGEKRSFGFVCPVLAGRCAVGHKWDGFAEWAQFDLAELNYGSFLALSYCMASILKRKVNMSVSSSMILDIGFPPPCPALVSMRSKIGLAPAAFA